MSITRPLASEEEIEQRQRDGEAEATKFGHRIGNWRYDPRYEYHRGRCLNQGCKASMIVEVYENSVAIGPSATSELGRCPFVTC